MSAKTQGSRKAQGSAAPPDDEIYRQLLESAAPINALQMQAIEENLAGFDVIRRCGLRVLTKSGKDLTDFCREDSAAAAAVWADIGGYLNNLHKLVELLDSAYARLMVGMTTDGATWKALEKARRSHKRAEGMDLTRLAS